MYLFKHFYIFEESDFIFHFLFQEKMDTSKRNMESFDKTTPKYISFKRKIISDNLLNPKDKEWEATLPKEQLKKLNDIRLKAELDSDSSDRTSKKRWSYHHYDDYNVGDYIWHGFNKKGEITKIYNLKNNQKVYDIKVGRQVFTRVHCRDLRLRANIRKQLEIVPDNLELQQLTTERLLNKFKRLRLAYMGVGIDAKGLNNKEYFFFLQIRKELCNRPHVKKKEEKYNK